MTQLNKKIETGEILRRELIYGPPKTKKTWWAAKAAESNFNVIVLDGDRGWEIMTNIPKEFQPRINVIEIADQGKNPVFAASLVQLLKDRQLIWDEQLKKTAKLNPNENCILLNLNELTMNDVLVIDSWSALVYSLLMQHAKENAIDLTDPTKADRDFYMWAGALANWMMVQLKSLPCHLIVIAHQTIYEKYKGEGKDRTLDWQRQQIVSTSGNQALTMAQHFSDVLAFSLRGSAFKINTAGDFDRDGGSRTMPPKLYDWNELQFVDICKVAGAKIPTKDNRYLDLQWKQQPSISQPQTGGLITAPASVVKAKTTALKIKI